MAKVVAIVNHKGGVGKTSTAHELGAGLQKRGKRVLFVELCGQCNLSGTFQVMDAPGNALDVLQGKASAEDTIQHTALGDIIPATPALFASANELITGEGKERRLADALEPVKKNYDFIVVDTPPALNLATVNALVAADEVIVPAEAAQYSLQGIGSLAETVNTVRQYSNPKLKIAGILLTKYKGRALLTKGVTQQLEALATALNTKLFTAKIRDTIKIPEAQQQLQDIFSYDQRSLGSQDYDAFIREYLKED